MRKKLASLLLILLVLLQGIAAGEDSSTIYRTVSEKHQIFGLGDTGWLIERWTQKLKPEATVTQAKSFNKVTSAIRSVKTYVYLINSSRTMNLDDISGDPPVWTVIMENYPNSTLESLQIDSLDTYKQYFYKTDHHWNYYASYLGYKQIIRMLLGEDEPVLEPVETVEFPVMFNGSYNKRLGRKDSDQHFTVYRFDYPAMTVRINGKKKKAYGRQETYFEGKISKKKLTNHYEEFYGGDEGIVEFCTDCDDKENIIIFCNSFSNAVKMLIASHFNHTYFVDLRHYQDDMGEKFNLTKSIKSWKVTKVMLLGDGAFFSLGTTYR